jgi:hypothetical protein
MKTCQECGGTPVLNFVIGLAEEVKKALAATGNCVACFAKTGDVLRLYDGRCLHCGAEPGKRSVVEDAAASFFSEDFKTKLRQGKYTSWAENITPDQLAAVLWAVGEFAGRTREDDDSEACADAHAEPRAVWLINHPRQSAALKILIRAGHQPGIGLEDALKLIRDADKVKP